MIKQNKDIEEKKKFNRKEYYLKNKDKILENSKNNYQKNKEKHKEYWNNYYSLNKNTKIREYFNKNKDKFEKANKKYNLTEKRKISDKKWYLKNKEKLKLYNKNNRKRKNELSKEKRDNNLNYKISCLIRSRIHHAIKKDWKNFKSLEIIGCSIEELKKHIEKQFLSEMKWNNWGVIWELDHKKPCSSFNLEDENQQKECFHYNNLQPLFKTTEIAESFGYKDQIGNRNKHKKIL